MGEIQDVHHPENQSEAGGNQKEKACISQSMEEKNENLIHLFLLSSDLTASAQMASPKWGMLKSKQRPSTYILTGISYSLTGIIECSGFSRDERPLAFANQAGGAALSLCIEGGGEGNVERTGSSCRERRRFVRLFRFGKACHSGPLFQSDLFLSTVPCDPPPFLRFSDNRLPLRHWKLSGKR